MSAVLHTPILPLAVTTTTKPSLGTSKAATIQTLRFLLSITTIFIVGIFLFTLPGSPFSTMTRHGFRVQGLGSR